MDIESRLRDLNLVLPPPPAPVARYVSAVRSGLLLFTSGILPMAEGNLVCSGKLGGDLSIEDGRAAARAAVLNALSVVRRELGKLDRVERVVKMTGYVASASGFTQQPAVLDEASSLLVEIFGDAGKHARAAVGVSELPLNAPIELELMIQIKP